MNRIGLMGIADDMAVLGNEGPGVISQVVAILKKVKPVLPTLRLVVDDPNFNAVFQRIQTLHQIEVSKPKAPSSGATPSTPVGVNLGAFLKPLDMLIFMRRNPWSPWALGAGLLLVVGGIGYRLGQRAS